jgi:hypothetical protein
VRARLPMGYGDLSRIAAPIGEDIANAKIVDAKKQMVNAICSKLGDVNTFGSIARLIGFARNFVSKRLLAKFKEDPGIMYRIGDDYRIPRATAERFIRDLYG